MRAPARRRWPRPAILPTVAVGPVRLSCTRGGDGPSVDSRPVSNATKRERQRQNRELARAREIALAKRRQRTKAVRNAVIAAVVVFGLVFLIQSLTGGGGKSKKKTAATSPTTAAPAATTTPVNAARGRNVGQP